MRQALHTDEAPCAEAQVGPSWAWNAPNELTGINDWYVTPVSSQGSVAAAEAWLEGVRARTPLFEPDAAPFSHDDVALGGGWYYSFDPANPDTGFHGALDYSKNNVPAGGDPTFAVHAVADGEVIAATWHDLLGNTLVIEHTAPDGTLYRSIYAHLRDGANHDCTSSKAFVSSDPSDPTNRETRFQDWVATQDCSALDPVLWGDESHTIAVNAGDLVTAGQFVAWTGATGHGGIGNAIQTGGVLPPGVTNNHLHLMFSVFDPATSTWTLLDPYGVYNDASNGCYELDQETEYARLFAPFYPSFHGVPLERFAHYFDYYPGTGLALQTLSPYSSGSAWLAAGAFQWGSPVWKTAWFQTTSAFQDLFDEYYDENLQLRELSVVVDGNGEPLFTGIWQQRTAASWGAFAHLTDAEYAQMVDELVTHGGHRIADRVSYTYQGVRQHAAIFVNDGVTDFHAPEGDSEVAFDSFAAARISEGYQVTSVSAEEASGGPFFGGVLARVAGDWVYDTALVGPDGYQARFDELVSTGYRLHRVQGYADGQRFAAVWTRSNAGAPCNGNQCLLGFESLQDWSSTGMDLALDPSRFTEGGASLALAGSGYNIVQSRVLGAGVIPPNATTVAFDVFVPVAQTNPYWVGAVQVYLQCPSVSIYNEVLGQVELTPLPRGQFNRLSFDIPSHVRTGLQQSPADCTVSIAMNLAGSSETYALDRLTFTP